MKNWHYVHSREDFDNLIHNSTYKGRKPDAEVPKSFPCLVCPRLGPWDISYSRNYGSYLHDDDVVAIRAKDYPRIERKVAKVPKERAIVPATVSFVCPECQTQVNHVKAEYRCYTQFGCCTACGEKVILDFSEDREHPENHSDGQSDNQDGQANP